MPASRREFLTALGGASVVRAQSRPNVVVLFTDDQRFDTIAALGNTEVKTPNMDRLVRRGVSFTHCATQGGLNGAICMPSRAQLLTGRSVFRVHQGIISRQERPDPSMVTFPELLRNAGYETHGIGKWHNGAPLYQRCFTSGGPIFFGGMSDQSRVPVQAYDPSGAYGKERVRIAEGFSSEIFASAAVDFLKGRERSKPYLLYVAFTSPHDPRMAPERFASMYDPARVSMPKNFMAMHPFDNGEMKVRDEMLAPHPRTESEIRKHIAGYYAMVSEVDAQVGRILDAVEQAGDASNTYIVFAGDNGLAVGQHGLLGKQNLYDHSLRVPLIISGPGIAAGKRADGLCHIMDLCPTICGWGGVEAPKGIEAVSLSPSLRKQSVKPRGSMVSAYRHVQRSIRTDEWKLILYNVSGTRTTQLFNLRRDPWEMTNLASREPGRVKHLSAQLQDELRVMGDPTRLEDGKWAT